MRIAFAIEHFDPAHGGAERYAWGLAQWLVARGHALDVYTLRADAETLPGVRVRQLDLSDARGRSRQARFAAALGSALAGEDYDVVQGFNHVWPCDVLRLGGGVHLAFEAYNRLSLRCPALRRLRRWLDEFSPKNRALRENERCQFGDPHRHFIAVSERVAQDMTRFYPAVSGRVHVIRNGVDLRRFHPDAARAVRADARARWDLGADEVALLFVSNNHRLKGLPDLIRALPILRRELAQPFRLLVVGRGHCRPYRRLAARVGVAEQVRWCGPAADMLPVYAAADVLVHPSYYDSFGTVVLEAAACGLPVVVSRNAGVSELLENEPGSIVIDMPCPRDELARAIVRAVEPAFREAARSSQFEVARRNAVERNYEAVEALYVRVAREKAMASRSSREALTWM